MKAKFLHHTPCPKCGSRDNRAVYDDGSSWCFGCGKYTPPTQRPIHIEEGFLPPPEDLTSTLPLAYNIWLHQYNLPKKEISNFKWSPSRNRLVSIITPDFWQERSLTKTPKILTHGTKPFKTFGTVGNECILVEDFISALKISKVSTSFCLFGTSVKDEHAVQLAKQFDSVFIWLDYDKYRKAIEISNAFKNYTNSWVILTKQDPKYHTFDEIKQQIKNGYR